ncbi:MAG: TRAP transporter large permease [Alphaproteobacteria bacterium]|nr:TRAP transporter large permease [Alphaproteobacteria bacterium]
MTDQTALLIALVVLVPVLLSGLPIAFSLLLVSIGYFLLSGSDAAVTASNMFWFLNKSELISIPFFILAADILGRSRATDDLVAAAEALFGWLRGGLALVTMVSTIVFSAISGSSVATAVAIGRVMIPKLVEAGYNRRFSVGLVAAGGGLGILIPPSVPLIIYATVAEISVADVFMAATGPGLLMGAVFCVFIVIMGNRARDPKARLVAPELRPGDRARLLLRAGPVILLPFLILGGIYGGYFTPGQAAAVSVIYAGVLSQTFYRRPGMEPLPRLVAEAGRLAAVILLIMAATSVFGYIITQNRIPFHFAQYIDGLGLSPFVFLICVNVLLLLLGCLLEIISVILITLPIFLPILAQLDINPVHFAIVMIINMELAVITPPIGMNLFVISSISDVPLLRVFQGTLPFVGLMLAMLLLTTYSEAVALATLRLFGG